MYAPLSKICIHTHPHPHMGQCTLILYTCTCKQPPSPIHTQWSTAMSPKRPIHSFGFNLGMWSRFWRRTVAGTVDLLSETSTPKASSRPHISTWRSVTSGILGMDGDLLFEFTAHGNITKTHWGVVGHDDGPSVFRRRRPLGVSGWQLGSTNSLALL